MLGLFCGQIVLCGIEVWSGKAWSVAAEGKLCLGFGGCVHWRWLCACVGMWSAWSSSLVEALMGWVLGSGIRRLPVEVLWSGIWVSEVIVVSTDRLLTTKIQFWADVQSSLRESICGKDTFGNFASCRVLSLVARLEERMRGKRNW